MRFKLVSKKSAKIIGKLAKTVMQETEQIKSQLALQAPLQQMHKALPPMMPPSAEDVEMIEEKVPEDEDHSDFVTVDGVMIKQDFDRFILDESEVDMYTPL